MKHTQSWLQGALSTGEGWIKNAGSFMNKHRYLIGGAIGGAAIGMAGLAAAAAGPQRRPGEAFTDQFGQHWTPGSEPGTYQSGGFIRHGALKRPWYDPRPDIE